MRTFTVITTTLIIICIITIVAIRMANPSYTFKNKEKAISLPKEPQLLEPGDNLRVYKIDADSIYIEYDLNR